MTYIHKDLEIHETLCGFLTVHRSATHLSEARFAQKVTRLLRKAGEKKLVITTRDIEMFEAGIKPFQSPLLITVYGEALELKKGKLESAIAFYQHKVLNATLLEDDRVDLRPLLKEFVGKKDHGPVTAHQLCVAVIFYLTHQKHPEVPSPKK